MLENQAAFRASTMTASLPSLPEMHGVDRARFEAEILPGDTAVILRGVAASWPAVAKGRESPLALAQYLAAMDNGRPVGALTTAPEEGGRLFFDATMTGFNYSHTKAPVSQLLEQMLHYAHLERAPAVAIQSAVIAQCLPQFKPDNPGAHHGHGCGQIAPVEYVVADDQAIAEVHVCIRARGARTGSNDDTAGRDAGVVGDNDLMVIQETRVALYAIRFGNGMDFAQDEADKTIALASDTIHDRGSVDTNTTVYANAKARRLPDGMGGIRGGNQELAWHAADARTGGAVIAALDDHGVRPGGLGCTICSEPRGTGTDYCNVNMHGLHFSRPLQR